jgi:hypothetical protein
VRRTVIVTAALGLAATAVVPAVAAPRAPVTGKLVFNGAWDLAPQTARGGLPAQWLGLQVKPGRRICFGLDCAGYALKLVHTPVRDGGTAARFTVKDGDDPFGDAERAEVQAKVTGRPGAKRWYTWSTYFPRGFDVRQADADRWLTFTQFAVSRGDAPIQLTVFKGDIALQVDDQSRPGRVATVQRPWGTPLAPHVGRWVDFALFVKWSPRGDGVIQLWVNGVRQRMNWPFGGDDPTGSGGVGAPSYAGRTLVPGGGPAYVRQGIVRAKGYHGTTTIVHDAFRVHAATRVPRPPAPTAPLIPPPAA